MGYYINRTSDGTPLPAKGKAARLEADGGKKWSLQSVHGLVGLVNFMEAEGHKPETYKQLVFVVCYPSHDAAAWAFSPDEADRFAASIIAQNNLEAYIVMYPHIRETVDCGTKVYDEIVAETIKEMK